MSMIDDKNVKIYGEYVDVKSQNFRQFLFYILVVLLLTIMVWVSSIPIKDLITVNLFKVSSVYQFSLEGLDSSIFIFIIVTTFWEPIIFVISLLIFTYFFAYYFKKTLYRTIFISLGSLFLAFIIYHVILFFMVSSSPSLFFTRSFTDIIQEVFSGSGPTISLDNLSEDLESIFEDVSQELGSLLYNLFYEYIFLDEKTIENYFYIYILGKTFESSIIWYRFDYIFIIIIYMLIFFPLFMYFVKSCECKVPFTDIILEREWKVAGKSEYRNKKTFKYGRFGKGGEKLNG